jgi:hypothetical protein
MIDKLKKIADAVQFLRLPSVALGLICVIAITTIIFGSKSQEGSYFAIPSFVGMVWSLNTYSFLVFFRTVPVKSDQSWNFIRRMKRRILRAGYLIMGVLFIVTTIGAIFVSFRMINIWFRDYG